METPALVTLQEFKNMFYKHASAVHNWTPKYKYDDELHMAVATYIMDGRDRSTSLYNSSKKDLFIQDMLKVKLERI
jgi:hypothetical protein